jgi:flagellum-specific peptidoglycan hydrolase FlgJ
MTQIAVINGTAKHEFFRRAIAAAMMAMHPFPEYAACEAALESAWGTSLIARKANNLFGQKEGFTTRDLPIIDVGTDEVVHGHVEHLSHAQWPMFPDWKTCFKERLELLMRASVYHDAMRALDGETFVREVSRHWATDPARAEKVLITYRVNRDLIEGVLREINGQGQSGSAEAAKA